LTFINARLIKGTKEEVLKMRLPEHWTMMVIRAREEQEIEKECQQHDLNFEVVKRIAEFTPFSLRDSFEFCLRDKEANDNWQRTLMRRRA
jgi:hypothetical protein